MRPKARWRTTRSIHATIATTVLAVPASAVALTTAAGLQTPADAKTPADVQKSLAIDVRPHNVAFGDDVTVTGAASAADQGATLLLETARVRGAAWHALTSTRVGRNGRFALRAPLRSSGLLRVLEADSAAGAHAVGPVADLAAQGVVASAPQAVTVAPLLRLARRGFDVLSGQRIDLRGRMLPSVAGHQVRLQGRADHAWQTLSTTRTGRLGGFDLHYVPAAAGRRALRVLFSGDRGNGPASRPAGQLNVYDQSMASWYVDAGATACGFHATFGVANRDLPCGTRVRLRYGGRTVTAVVDDRGPYVGGRDWDLNQNTASALGFAGIGAVWSAV
jgi:rare lipoprotein A